MTVHNPTAPLPNHMRRYDIATVGLLLLAVTVYFSYAHLRDFAWQLKAHMRFEPVAATIVESTVHSTGHATGQEEMFQPHIVYRYSLDGVDYQSDRIYFGSGGWRNQRAAEVVVSGYPEGAHVNAYVDDEFRNLAVLDRRRPESGVLIYMLPLTAASVAAMVFGLRKHIKH